MYWSGPSNMTANRLHFRNTDARSSLFWDHWVLPLNNQVDQKVQYVHYALCQRITTLVHFNAQFIATGLVKLLIKSKITSLWLTFIYKYFFKPFSSFAWWDWNHAQEGTDITSVLDVKCNFHLIRWKYCNSSCKLPSNKPPPLEWAPMGPYSWLQNSMSKHISSIRPLQ